MIPPHRILVACDKFKGSLTADEACAAIARGLQRRWPAATVDCRPIADGGEGFAAAMAKAHPGRWVEAPSRDALGRPIRARYFVTTSDHETLAVMEMAEASGLWRIAAEDRDILHSTTAGTGEMIRHAVECSGATRIVLGIGGSATNDGGAGMATALGVRFLDARGEMLEPCPASLVGRLARIDAGGRLPLPPIAVACDVVSPLLGPLGASRVFGPQKGADESSIPALEEALAAIVRASGGEADAARPGAGAAGGLGFGLLHFAGANLVPGFELLAALTGLADRVSAADLVVTGEGSLDAQSLAGKGPVGVARLARRHGKAVWAYCGRADAVVRDSGIFDRVAELASSGRPTADLLARAAVWLEALAADSGAGGEMVHGDGIEPPTDRV